MIMTEAPSLPSHLRTTELNAYCRPTNWDMPDFVLLGYGSSSSTLDNKALHALQEHMTAEGINY